VVRGKLKRRADNAFLKAWSTVGHLDRGTQASGSRASPSQSKTAQRFILLPFRGLSVPCCPSISTLPI